MRIFQYKLKWHYSFINKSAEVILLKSELTHKYQRNRVFGRFGGCNASSGQKNRFLTTRASRTESVKYITYNRE
jgi:hypothetical protein